MDLCNIDEIKALLARHGFHFSKAKGQNFLTQSWVPQNIVLESGVDETCGVLEVGPGIGPLTQQLCRYAKKVVAVEVDRTLQPVLAETMAGNENLEIIFGDILKTDISALVQEEFAGLRPMACANLPYYITTPIAEQFLPMLPRVLLLMVQQEAAARFFAAPGDRVYGPVAILSALYYEAARLFSVPPGSYYPQPDVESAVILLRRRDDDALKALPAANAMLRFSRTALSMRRKTLANNFPRDGRMSALLAEAGLDPAVRAETLPPETLAALCTAYPADDALSAR